MVTNIRTVQLLVGSGITALADFDSDPDIQEYLDITTAESGVEIPSEAAAKILDAVSTSKALLEQASKTLNWSGDNKGLSDNLAKRAESLRKTEASRPYAVDVVAPATPFAVLDHQENLAKEAGLGS